jgi:hypothetical protein
MPHVIVKLWPGKSDQQKARLAGKIAKDVMEVFEYPIVSRCSEFLDPTGIIGQWRTSSVHFPKTRSRYRKPLNVRMADSPGNANPGNGALSRLTHLTPLLSAAR